MTMTCETCKEPIEGKSIMALGKNYHPDHFVCGVCQKPITDSSFHQKDGKPLCRKDYEASCPRCAACALPITDKVVKAMGNTWHENHFLCSLCDETLCGKEFHEKEGKPICHTCFKGKVADKCKACGEPIDTSATIALDAKWHPDCFKCKKCSKAITSETFKVDTKGYPLCEKC